MKRVLKTGMILLAAAALLSGCSGKSGKEETTSADPAQVLYPVAIDGKEILVGETTVQTLLDQGMNVTVSEMTEDKQINQYEIDPEAELEPNTYYTGGSIWVTDSIFAHISLVTDEKAVRMGDAVIARLEFSLVSGEESELKRIAFNGVPVSEMSREKAGEMFPDFSGDDYMWLQKGEDYEYFMSFDPTDHMLSSFSLEKEYDVDWSSEE